MTHASSSKPTIEELRAKRLEREKEERRRADILLGKIAPDADNSIEDRHDPNRYLEQLVVGVQKSMFLLLFSRLLSGAK